MILGFSFELMSKGRKKESQACIKRFMMIMDSMNNEGITVSTFCLSLSDIQIEKKSNCTVVKISVCKKYSLLGKRCVDCV